MFSRAALTIGETFMENKKDSAKLKDDVLRSEHHSTLSAEEIAKAVQRHNREHKGDAQKSTRQATVRGKKG
jgi:phage-related minor tail protein